ncbi:MAG: aminodeoxychorismate/anthranilate synthase component II [Sandaracinaceae bacterium]
MICVIDNYDSFTYNLVQYLAELGAKVEVHRNDAISVDALRALRPEGILVSPGPGRPEDAGISMAVLAELGGEVPILGVCLGHQAIAQRFGGRVVRAERLMHGRTSEIHHDGQGVFRDLPSPFVATRYHSLIVEPATLPAVLVRTAWTDQGEIMGLRHATLPIEGVQFHPESFLTEHGHAMLERWLDSLDTRGRR